MEKITTDMDLQATFDWIGLDRQACREDVARMGLDGAVEHNYKLIQERIRDGYGWQAVTIESLHKALKALIVGLI